MNRQAGTKFEAARQFQERLAPAPLPSCCGIKCFTYCRRYRADGSFFDLFQSGRDEISSVIGSVNRKGNVGAMLITGVQASLRCMVRRGIDPPEAVSETNRLLWELAPDGICGTMLSARIDPWMRQLRYINAGHHTAFIIRRDRPAHYLEPNAPPLALSYGSAYRELAVPFNPGDVFITASEDIDREDVLRVIAGRMPGGGCPQSAREWPAQIGEASPAISARIVIVISWRDPEHGAAVKESREPVALVSAVAA